MTLDILDIPEDPGEIGAWLDRRLVGESLARDIADLATIHGAAAESLSAEDARAWLGDDVAAVLARGLASLNRSRLGDLLRRPALLPAIQELAIMEGGPYWESLVRESSAICDRVERGKLTLPKTVVGAETSPLATLRPIWPRRFLTALVPLAVAASIAAFVVVQRDGDGVPAPPGSPLKGLGTGGLGAGLKGLVLPSGDAWGWNRVGIVAPKASGEHAATALADALEEWFDVVARGQVDVAMLRQRGGDLLAGCDRVVQLPLEGCDAATRTAIRGAAEQLRCGVKDVLDTLPTDTPGIDEAAAARRTIDKLVRGVIESLRVVPPSPDTATERHEPIER